MRLLRRHIDFTSALPSVKSCQKVLNVFFNRFFIRLLCSAMRFFAQENAAVH